MISTSTVVAIGSATVLAAVYAAVANAQLDTSTPEVDALLRAIGFSPYGAVMIWIGIVVKKTLAKLESQVDAAIEVAREFVVTNQEMTKAVRERTAAEYAGTAANAGPHRRREPRGHG